MLEVGWGVDGAWMPLPTRPQQYCDPVSLVMRVKAQYFFPVEIEHPVYRLKDCPNLWCVRAYMRVCDIAKKDKGTLHRELRGDQEPFKIR